MLTLWKLLTRDQRGTTSVEYGLIIGVTVLVVIGAMSALGDKLQLHYGDMEDMLVQAGKEAPAK
jgi:Flp pilus assembly pilin Flp